MAPVVKELAKRRREFSVKVCVTAQHRQMLDEVLKIFAIKPEFDLNIMQDGQDLFHVTSAALGRMKDVLLKVRPDLVLVHGDTTTTFAASLAAFYLKIPVGHVEAGLRTYDRTQPFPEEANRLLADDLCELYFAPTSTAKSALQKENLDPKRIFVTGNTVIDALQDVLALNRHFKNPLLKKLSSNVSRLPSTGVVLLTAHRRENFGKPFEGIFKSIARLAGEYPGITFVYPVHLNPNVQGPAKRYLSGRKNIQLLPPLNYADLAGLMKLSQFVITDSGGIQEEAPSLGKPVLVLREVTERPEAVKAGTVKVIGTDGQKVYRGIRRLIDDKKAGEKMSRAVNPYGDGRAAFRTVEAIRYYFGFRKDKPADFIPKKLFCSY